GDHPFPARIVREVAAVLGEQDRLPACQESRGGGVEERCVLMGVNQRDVLASQESAESKDAPPVHTGATTERHDGEALFRQFFPQPPQSAQTGETDAIVLPKVPPQAGGQYFGPADV